MIAELDTIRRLFEELKKRLVLFLCLATSIFGSSVVYIVSQPKQFESSSLVLVSPSQSADFGDIRNKIGAVSDPIQLRTEIEVLTSDQICLQVIEKLELDLRSIDRADDSVGSKRGSVENAIIKNGLPSSKSKMESGDYEKARALSLLVKAYKEHLAVYNDGRSSIAKISFTSQDPLLAVNIANAHTQAYLKSRLERRMETTDTSDSKIISSAMIPTSPSSPKLRLFVAVSFLISTFLALLLVVILPITIQSLKKQVKFTSRLELDIIANIIVSDEEHKDGFKATRSPSFEQEIRDLRVKLITTSSRKSGALLFVSNTRIDEGPKVAFAVAQRAALSGFKTVYIDADPKNISRYSARSNPYGLDELLRSENKLPELIAGGSYLNLITMNDGRDTPFDLLVGPRMEKLIQKLGESFDVIIIVAPPMSDASDYISLTDASGRIVIVLDNDSVDNQRIDAYIKQLRAAKKYVVGAVLISRNRSRISQQVSQNC